MQATFSSDKKPIIDSDFSLSLSPLQKNKLNFLKNTFSPYTKKAYIVGGFLRDNYLNIPSDDIDIEIYDITQNQYLELMKQIEAQELSSKFFVYNYQGIDLALPRVETKVSKGYHGFDIQITNDEYTATLRRDFSINALMYNIFDEQLLDFHNGICDIENRVLNIINKEHFKEDSLRLLRAIRFMIKYNLSIDDESKNILASMNIDELSKSRINKELHKIFLSI